MAAGGDETSPAIDHAPAADHAPTVATAPTADPAPPADPAAGDRFRRGLLGAVALGAVVRIAHVLTTDNALYGDGKIHAAEAARLADGLGMTTAFGEVGAETARNEPLWTVVLAAADRIGLDAVRAQQAIALVVGLALVAVAGLVGRRYFGARVGILAAGLAAVFPGFWVLEAGVNSEPLALLLLGCLLLLLADVRGQAPMRRAALIGALCGLLVLTKAEMVVLVLVGVVPLFLRARARSTRRRVQRLGVALAAMAVVVAPWAVHNELRFDGRVLISTSWSRDLLAGNCPPDTSSGPALGTAVNRCGFEVTVRHRIFELDESELARELRAVAMTNLTENLDDLPVTAAARLGRTIGVFRPNQTIDLGAASLQAERWRVSTWVAATWVVLALAVVGVRRARREELPLRALLGPVLAVALVAGLTYGDPRQHAMADLSLVVLAAFGLDRALAARPRIAARAPAAEPEPPADDAAVGEAVDERPDGALV